MTPVVLASSAKIVQCLGSAHSTSYTVLHFDHLNGVCYGRSSSQEFICDVNESLATLLAVAPVTRDKVEVWRNRLICPSCITGCSRCRAAHAWWFWARREYLALREVGLNYARDFVTESSDGECVLCV